MWGNSQSNPNYWINLLNKITALAPFEVALDKWEQGDLLRNVPITWLAPPGHDVVFNLSSQLSTKGFSNVTPELSYAVICSQTCDIAGVRIGARHPFILVAPVINSQNVDPKVIAQARRGGVGYLVPLLAKNNEFASGDWFADLRHITSVSKSLLIQVASIGDFLTEDTKLLLGRKLAGKFSRVAFGEPFTGFLFPELEKYIKGALQSNAGAFGNVDQVRVRILRGTKTKPEVAQFLLVEKISQPIPAQEQNLWLSWESAAATHIDWPKGLTLSPALFADPNTLPASIYRDSSPIELEGIPDNGHP